MKLQFRIVSTKFCVNLRFTATVLGKKRGYNWEKCHSNQQLAVVQPEHALLLKLFCENNGNAAAIFREYRRLKNLRKGPLRSHAVRIMISRFEKTGDFRVQPGRESKFILSDVFEDVATIIVEQSMGNIID